MTTPSVSGSGAISQQPSPTSDTAEANSSTTSFAGHDRVQTVPGESVVSAAAGGTGPADIAIADRDAAPAPANGTLPSVRGNDIDQLKAQKQELLKKAGDAHRELGQDSIIGRAKAALQQQGDAATRELDQLLVTVTPPPPPPRDPITVFPPDPDIPEDEMKKYQAIAIKSLSQYQQQHPVTADRKKELEKIISDSEADIVALQTRFTELQVEDDDCVKAFEELKNRVYSFELASNEGDTVSLQPRENLTLEEIRKYRKTKSAGKTEEPGSSPSLPRSGPATAIPAEDVGSSQPAGPSVEPPQAGAPPPPPPPPPPIPH